MQAGGAMPVQKYKPQTPPRLTELKADDVARLIQDNAEISRELLQEAKEVIERLQETIHKARKLRKAV